MGLLRYIPIVLLGYANLIDKSTQFARPSATLFDDPAHAKSFSYNHPSKFHDARGIPSSKNDNYNLEIKDGLELEVISRFYTQRNH